MPKKSNLVFTSVLIPALSFRRGRTGFRVQGNTHAGFYRVKLRLAKNFSFGRRRLKLWPS